MAYADVPAVRGRAGGVSRQWSGNARPSDTDLQRFLDQATAEIDAKIASLGYIVPVTDPTAAGALESLTVAGALVKALPATFASEQATANVSSLLERVTAEWENGLTAIMEGKHGVIVYLGSLSTSPLPTSLFVDEPFYGYQGYRTLKPNDEPPPVHMGMKF